MTIYGCACGEYTIALMTDHECMQGGVLHPVLLLHVNVRLNRQNHDSDFQDFGQQAGHLLVRPMALYE